MSDSFGARLRQRREEQNIALTAIAEQTKIKLSLLEALERDDVSHWPSGIFRRAYVRAYAHAIGLSPDAVVREFLDVFPDPAEDITSALATSSAGDRDRGGARTRFRHLVSSALGSFSRSPRVEQTEDREPSQARRVHGSDADLQASLETWRERGLVEGTSGVSFQEPQNEQSAFDLEFLDGEPSDAGPSGPVFSEREYVDAAPPVELDAVTSDAPGPIQNDVAALEEVPSSPEATPDFAALAGLCTRMGRADQAGELEGLLEEAAGILDARGLIVWLWDGSASALRPVLVYGYSDQVVAQLPPVKHDADNATAAAFRLAQPCSIKSGDGTSGALVLPLLTPAGCAGVLALELQDGREQAEPVRAAATIVTALLSQLVGGASPAEAVEEEHPAMRPAVGDLSTPVLRVNVRPDGHARMPIR